MAKDSSKKSAKPANGSIVDAICVRGYKSLSSEQRIELANLTILAGANSSGKSSMLQPLLLLKQTMDAPYDPGALLLNGSNVRLTTADQLLSKIRGSEAARTFSIQFAEASDWSIRFQFKRVDRKGFDIDETDVAHRKKVYKLTATSRHEEIIEMLLAEEPTYAGFLEAFTKGSSSAKWAATRERCFFQLSLKQDITGTKTKTKASIRTIFQTTPPRQSRVQSLIQEIIHVPGLRGNPERTYKTTAVGSSFPGTFEVYVASIINHWQENKDERLSTLGKHLARLGLTWKVKAIRVDDTQVELKVGRLTKGSPGGQHDLVSIADVGFGMSQVLPVVVALLVAKKGQFVYIEQPEIHLHPRAQSAMAGILADAARRGVRVVIETHSALLLLGIQTLVATSKLDAKHVRLNWFERSPEGATQVRSGEMDETGAFGLWPEDFGEVVLSAQQEYLDAVEKKLVTH